MSSIVVYFSRPGSNWVQDGVRDLKIGNCAILAEYVQKQTKSDIYRIQTIHTYTDDYYKATEEAKAELANNARPTLTSYPETIEKYDIIYLIYPIWWSTCPMAIFSFLEHYNFTNKTIIPLCTHEGSGIANSVNDIQKNVTSAKIKPAYEVFGYKCQELNNDAKLQQDIKNFLQETK